MANDEIPKQDESPDYIRRLLKEPPLLLKNFHYEDINEFLNMGTPERFLKNEVVVVEGDYVNSAFLIAEGEVSVWKDNIQMTVLDERHFLGETFLFSKNNRMAKVVSETNSLLLEFKRHDALNFFRKKPEKLFNIFTRNIIEIQQKKISNMNVQLLKLKKRLLDDAGW